MRPVDSVTGTRWTRWTPDSYLNTPYAPLPLMLEDDLLQAAQGRLVGGEDLHLEATPLGVLGQHAEDLGGEERGFVPAGGRAHLDDDVLLVARVLLEHGHADLLFEHRHLLAGGVALLE